MVVGAGRGKERRGEEGRRKKQQGEEEVEVDATIRDGSVGCGIIDNYHYQTHTNNTRK